MASRKLTVESALKRLQEITDSLEKGELSLEQSLKLYEEGVGLTAACKKMLDDAELKIAKLSIENETGEAEND